MDFQTLYDVLRQYGHRWTLEILTELQSGPRRYTDLLRSIAPPPSSKVLMEALKRLQAEGLVSRSANRDGAVYELTNAGRDLLPVLMDFWANWKRWSQKHIDSRKDV